MKRKWRKSVSGCLLNMRMQSTAFLMRSGAQSPMAEEMMASEKSRKIQAVRPFAKAMMRRKVCHGECARTMGLRK